MDENEIEQKETQHEVKKEPANTDQENEKPPVKEGSEAKKDRIVIVPVLEPYVPPPVYITEVAAAEMYKETIRHYDIETGWGLYGLEFSDGAILIYGTLLPLEEDIVRRTATTEVGGTDMVNALRWLKSNHELLLKHSKTARGVQPPKFMFLWKGHSHHTMGLKQYSGTDNTSIIEAVEKDGMKVAIGPLANIIRHGIEVGYDSRFLSWSKDVLRVRSIGSVELRFHYFDRKMLELGYKRPILIAPILVKQESVPVIPPLGWKFTDNTEYLEQKRHLKNYGCTVQVIHQDTDGKPPFEIKFVIKNPDWVGQTLIIETSWNFPKDPPRWYVLPKGKKGRARYKCPRHLLDDPLWTKGDDFIDLIFRLEARGYLKRGKQ
jgi:hypothetical protein